MTVRFEEKSRKQLEDLSALFVNGENGAQVPLSEVAEIVTDAGAGSIRHKDRDRVITVSASVDGRLPNDVRIDVEATLAKETFPEKYKWKKKPLRPFCFARL